MERIYKGEINMEGGDKFKLWLMIRDTVKRWRSDDGAWKIHLYDGASDERKIGKMISELCDNLEPLMTTKKLPKRSV